MKTCGQTVCILLLASGIGGLSGLAQTFRSARLAVTPENAAFITASWRRTGQFWGLPNRFIGLRDKGLRQIPWKFT
jgi:hypothetical protein